MKAVPPYKPDTRPACAWADFVLIRGCVYKALPDSRYCAEHAYLEKGKQDAKAA